MNETDEKLPTEAEKDETRETEILADNSQSSSDKIELPLENSLSGAEETQKSSVETEEELKNDNQKLKNKIALMEMGAGTQHMVSLEGLWQLDENKNLSANEFKAKYSSLFSNRVKISGASPIAITKDKLREEARQKGDVRKMLSFNRGKETK